MSEAYNKILDEILGPSSNLLKSQCAHNRTCDFVCLECGVVLNRTSYPPRILLKKDVKEELSVCEHAITVDDVRSGCIVCCKCGLVLEQIYLENFEEAMEIKEESDCHYIKDICSQLHIPRTYIEHSNPYFVTISTLLKGSSFHSKALRLYALYETLRRCSITRCPKELAICAGLKESILWSIERALNKIPTPTEKNWRHPYFEGRACHSELTPTRPEHHVSLKYTPSSKTTLPPPKLALDYVERFACALSLSFSQISIVKHLLQNMFGWGALRPHSAVAAAIFLYSNHMKHKLDRKKICEACGVSYANVYRIIRKVDKEYVKQLITTFRA